MAVTPTAASATLPTDTSERLSAKVLLAVLFTVFAWASAFVVIRYVGPHYGPGSLAVGRLLVGSVVLSLLMIGRKFVPMQRNDWLLTILVGVIWFGVYNVALNAGEHSVDAGTAAMIIQIAPILIGVIAGLVLGEGFPRMLVIGGLVAFAGTLVIGFATSTGDAHAGGVALIVLAAVVYSVAMVAQKVVLRRIPGLQLTWLACLAGTAVTLPFVGQFVGDLRTAPAAASFGILFLGIVPTALAFTTWAYALSTMSAGRLGITTYVVPPIAIGLGWLFLNEVPALLAVVGGLLSLVGVALARYQPRRKAVPAPAA